MRFYCTFITLGMTDQTLVVRVPPRFFDQVRHQTTNASIGNKYPVTKSLNKVL